MAEHPSYVPPGAEGEESDVLGKLDSLLNKHKSRPRDRESEPVPVLTEALPQNEADAIPTLTDIVAPGASPPGEVDRHGLAGDLVRRLAMRLEIERASLAATSNGDPARIAMLDELATRLRDALPGVVLAVLEREERH